MKLFKILLAMSLFAFCVGTARAADSQAQALAREALERKLRDIQGSQPVSGTNPMPAVAAPATPGFAPVPAPGQAAPLPVAPPANAVTAAPPLSNPPSADSAKIAKAREALHQKMNELGVASSTETAPPIAPSPTVPGLAGPGFRPAPSVSRKTPRVVQAFPPLPVPSSPLTGDKAQRLAELLRRYQADEITPQQYHAERAKLVGADL